MDMIIPESVDPTIRLIINILVGVHLLAFFTYVWLLMRSSNKTQADEFRDQYKQMEGKIAQQKSRTGKQD
jgi:preprotein translocase subunit SecY